MKHSIQSITSDDEQLIATLDQKAICFPEGMPAFENIKNFLLIAKEEDFPFLWLQAVDAPQLAFVVVDPFLVCPEYQPEVLDEDVEMLGLEKPEDALIVSIVNIKQINNGDVTVNLVGPIVVNWKNKKAKQVIIKNHMDYSVKYKIDPN